MTQLCKINLRFKLVIKISQNIINIGEIKIPQSVATLLLRITVNMWQSYECIAQVLASYIVAVTKNNRKLHIKSIAYVCMYVHRYCYNIKFM